MDWIGLSFIGMAIADYIKEEERNSENRRIKAYNDVIQAKQDQLSSSLNSMNNFTNNTSLNSYRTNKNKHIEKKVERLEREKKEYV